MICSKSECDLLPRSREKIYREGGKLYLILLRNLDVLGETTLKQHLVAEQIVPPSAMILLIPGHEMGDTLHWILDMPRKTG